MRGKMVKVIIGSILFAVGVGVTIWGFSKLQSAKESLSWPRAEGRVLESNIERVRKTSSRSRRKRRRGKNRIGTNRQSRITYKANVFYEYSVKSNKYSSDKISFGDYSSSNQSHAQNIVNRYPRGKDVKVYYNPEDPQLAVLEPGVSWATYTPLGAGVFFILIGGAFAAASFFGRK
jgi:hypothetical protein